MKKQLFLTLSALFTLSGCGGGGSAADFPCQIGCDIPYEANLPSPRGPQTAEELRDIALQEIDREFSEHREESEEALMNARETTPRRGSVVQSTNDSGVTKDLFSAELERNEQDLTWRVTYDTDPEDENSDKGSTEFITRLEGGAGYLYDQRLEFHNSYGFIDNLQDSDLFFVLVSDYGRYSDYSILGLYWSYPKGSFEEGSVTFGAFADGNQPMDVDITTPNQASYKGEMLGTYWRQEPTFFTADTLLTVNFGNSPSIAGGFENIKINGSNVIGRIDLQSAIISTEEGDGGFFTGDLAGTINGHAHVGNWGGQFYGKLGNHPRRVSGTAIGGSPEGGQPFSFISAYWTYRELLFDDIIALADEAFREALPGDINYSANYLDYLGGIRNTETSRQISTNNADEQVGVEGLAWNDRMMLALSGSLGQIQYDLMYTQEHSEDRTYTISKVNDLPSYLREGSRYQRLVISGDVTGNNGKNPFDALSNSSVSGKFSALVYSNYDGEGDADYFAGGVWLYVPDDDILSTGLISHGAFMDGKPLTIDIGSRPEATYNGEMMGLYLESPRNERGEFDDRPISFFSLSGNVSLTAKFAEEKISGSFTNIEATDKAGASKRLGDITLGTANISNGSFRGALSADWVTGHYDGKFYGTDEPLWVAGSAGGADSGENYHFSAIYSAKERVEEEQQ